MASKNFYKINALQDEDSAEILIYGPIGTSWWEEAVGAKDFVQEINTLDVNNLTVRINSVGGSVVDGIAIFNAIKRHKATVTTVNDGLAASIASLILMAGDSIEMASNAKIMIHAPWTYAEGNAVQLREVADMLDSWADAMSGSYAVKAGKTKEDILSMLTDGKDHLFGAEEALAEGFIDTITGGLTIAASLNNKEILAQVRSFYAAQTIVAKPVAAATITKETHMPQAATVAAATPNATEKTVDQIRAEAVAQESERRNSIGQAFAKFTTTPGVAELMAACQNDISCSVQVANDRLLAKLGEGAASVAGTHVVTIEDERDKARAGITQAVLSRAGLAKAESNNQFRGYTLYEMARASLEQSGFKTNGLGKMDLVAASFTHSTSDFTNLLANIANKAMMKGYEEAEETFQLWTSEGNLPDFKTTKRVDLNAFPSLDKVLEGAEYKYATVGDRGETVQLATYGKLFSITRQAIINDDLDAFTKIPQRMGRAAIRTVGDLVYAVLTGAHNMYDGKTLFHADHANIATAAALSTAAVDALRVKMALQKDGNATLNIRLANLIVPVALEGLAKTVRDSEFEISATRDATTPNSVRGTFEVISDARLDAASSTAYYGAANASVTDTVEVQYLDGNKAPTLEQQNGWGVDGVDFKVRMDAGVKALSWKALAKNAGA